MFTFRPSKKPNKIPSALMAEIDRLHAANKEGKGASSPTWGNSLTPEQTKEMDAFFDSNQNIIKVGGATAVRPILPKRYRALRDGDNLPLTGGNMVRYLNIYLEAAQKDPLGFFADDLPDFNAIANDMLKTDPVAWSCKHALLLLLACGVLSNTMMNILTDKEFFNVIKGILEQEQAGPTDPPTLEKQ